MVKCTACGGTYEPIGLDGLQYFHRCSPLSAVELQKAVDDGRVQLPANETADIAVQRRIYERKNLRDENRPSTTPQKADAMKAAGAGVIDVATDPKVATVVTVDPAPAVKA